MLKAQASLEQLIVTGIALTFIAIMFYFSINYANDSARVSQAQHSVDKIAKSADYVYALGSGSKEEVDIYVPDGVRSINVTGNRVHMKVSLSSGDTDVFANTKAPLTGTIPLSSGRKTVVISSLSNGKVKVGRDVITCSPTSITASLEQGNSSNASFSITNVLDYTIFNISAYLSGNIDDLTTLTQPGTSLAGGAADTVGLSFLVPLAKAVGSYSGTVTVNGSNSSECSTSVTIFVTRTGGADTQGPAVTALSYSPIAPVPSDSIVVNATGDDSGTGNSSISSCQVELDNSGIWNTMTPVDGSYDAVSEDVTYDVGTVGSGNHTITVRCIDVDFNVGAESSASFETVITPDIIIITLAASPSTDEQRWIDWIAAHSSNESFAWDYEQVSVASVTAGTVNVSRYGIVVMADHPTTDATLDSILNDYRNSGRYVVLLGEAMQYGLKGLGDASGDGGSGSKDELKIQAAHYVTSGYSVGSLYEIVTISSAIHYHDSFTATNIASMEDNDANIVIGEASNLITYGSQRPDKFNANGDVIATRVLDHALLNS